MELSIDTASELASIALSREGVLVAENSWHCRRNHTVEVLPAIDRLLSEAGIPAAELTAVFVSTGPGMYTGLRVGISIAKGMAHALRLPMAGVGRLELDAYPHRDSGTEIVAIHRAGRGELAWASYRDGPWREVRAPGLSQPDELTSAITEHTLFVGEIDVALAETLREALGGRATIAPASETGLAAALAALGGQRLTAGHTDAAAAVKPVYLRPPAIGPQPS